MQNKLTLAVFTAALAVSACGGEGSGTPVDNKDSAAGAAYDVKQKGEGLHARRGQGLKPAQQIPDVPGTGGISAEQTFTIQGQSGQAIVTEKSDIGSGGIMAEWTIKYENFSEDGVETYDGEITHRALVSGNGIETQLLGTVDVSGKRLATLEMDVFVKVTGNGIEMRGFVSADGTRYDYSGDIIDLDAID